MSLLVRWSIWIAVFAIIISVVRVVLGDLWVFDLGLMADVLVFTALGIGVVFVYLKFKTDEKPDIKREVINAASGAVAILLLGFFLGMEGEFVRALSFTIPVMSIVDRRLRAYGGSN